MNIKLVFVILFVFLIGGLVLVNSEEGAEEDFTSLLGIGGDIAGSGIDYAVEETSQRKDATFIFTEGDSFLDIGENRFENIQPASDNLNAFIELDRSGEIISADFMTNEKGGTYDFFGDEFFVPANSRVIFDDKNGLIIEAAKGSEFSENSGLKDLKVIGEDVVFSGGEFLETGTIHYGTDGKIYLIESGSKISINDISIISEEDLSVYYGGQHEGNYVSFGENDFYLGGNSGKVIFGDGNDYFTDMKTGTSVELELLGSNSEIYIDKGRSKIIYPTPDTNYPTVYCENQYSIETGDLKLVSNGEQIYQLDGSFEGNRVNMDIVDFGKDANVLISIRDNSYTGFKFEERLLSENKYSFYSSGDFLSRESNVLGGKLDDKYREHARYVDEANEKYLQKAFADINPGLDTSIFENVKTNTDLDEIAAGDYNYLTFENISDLLKGTEYENYFEKVIALEKVQAVVVPTSGQEENLGESKLYGPRNLFRLLDY